MADFFEIDFLKVGDTESGDAICIRYEKAGVTNIHVVDGGYTESGSDVVSHLKKFYGTNEIHHIVATHPDGDHASGLQTVLDECYVGALWMNRPWIYANELLPRFKNYTNVETLRRKLREVFPYLAKLEDIALEKNIPIYESFQGEIIGAFTVLGPTKERFLDCVVECDRTPAAKAETSIFSTLGSIVEAARNVVGNWGIEVFPADDTTPRNSMSVVQTALLSNSRILLTADAGRAGLHEAADYAEAIGIGLPISGRMQVPHHGSRHNVDSSTLDRWLGAKTAQGSAPISTAIVSAAQNDDDHPRKVVTRAFMHRGAKVFTTKNKGLCSSGGAAPNREGWRSATQLAYPDEYEDG